MSANENEVSVNYLPNDNNKTPKLQNFNFRKRKSAISLQSSYSSIHSTNISISDTSNYNESMNNDSIAARLKRRRLSNKEYLRKQKLSNAFVEERRVERLWRELKKNLVIIFMI